MDNLESVVVVATLVPLPGQEEKVETALLEAVAATHEQDRGCELYAAHRSIRGKAGFVVIEKWSSADELQAHGAGKAFAALTAAVGGLLAEPLAATVLRSLPAGNGKLGML